MRPVRSLVVLLHIRMQFRRQVLDQLLDLRDQIHLGIDFRDNLMLDVVYGVYFLPNLVDILVLAHFAVAHD